MSMTTTTTMTIQQEEKYKQGKHYIELSTPLKQAPPVIVFFSFLDSNSYEWATKNQVTMTLRRHVPAGTIIDRYHAPINQLADFAQDLTAAWAVAKAMQLDDQIITPLFEAIQNSKTVVDMEGVKLVFDQIGVPPLRFDREYAKIAVQKEARWMQEVQRDLRITRVPAIVVDGKYLLKLNTLGSDTDAARIADMVKGLLNLKR